MPLFFALIYLFLYFIFSAQKRLEIVHIRIERAAAVLSKPFVSSNQFLATSQFLVFSHPESTFGWIPKRNSTCFTQACQGKGAQNNATQASRRISHQEASASFPATASTSARQIAKPGHRAKIWRISRVWPELGTSLAKPTLGKSCGTLCIFFWWQLSKTKGIFYLIPDAFAMNVPRPEATSSRHFPATVRTPAVLSEADFQDRETVTKTINQ